MDESDEDVIDDLTVALHLDAIEYDSKNQEYEIQLSKVRLVHLDLKNDTIRLKVPFHRLQRIKTPTYNAESYSNNNLNIKFKPKHVRHTLSNASIISSSPKPSLKSPTSDKSHQSDHEHDHDELNGNDPNLDEIVAMVNNEDFKSDEQEQDILSKHDDEKNENAIKTPQRPRNLNKNIDIKPLKKQTIIKEWTAICKKYPISNAANTDPNQAQTPIPVITKDGCFSRIVFILKNYTKWILHKEKTFKSKDLPKVQSTLRFISLSSISSQIRKIIMFVLHVFRTRILYQLHHYLVHWKVMIKLNY